MGRARTARRRASSCSTLKEMQNVAIFGAGGAIGIPVAEELDPRGIDTIFYCVGLPYPSHALHPVLIRTTVEAAKMVGVERLVLVSSVYPYGVPRASRVAETHPREPHTRKGQYRKEQEDLVLGAHNLSGLRTLVVRLPDFYGPHAELSLAHMIFDAAVKGKTANWPGPANTLHELVYTPDTGPVIA